jgi:hypothetical protein
MRFSLVIWSSITSARRSWPKHKDGRGYHGDQVNGPRVVASTHKFDMAGAVFVSICVKAHGGGLNLLSEDPLLRTQNISPFWPARGCVGPR